MNPGTNIQPGENSDSKGPEETNGMLSLDGASADMEFLKLQGVDVARMTAKGIAAAGAGPSSGTAGGLARNSRVENVVPGDRTRKKGSGLDIAHYERARGPLLNIQAREEHTHENSGTDQA